MFVRKLFLFVLFNFLMASVAVAGVPPMISYQGKLMQPSGAPVPDGTYSIQFAIYDAPAVGATLWSETNTTVQVKGGLFSVLLGSVINLPGNIFDNPVRWFGVKVGSDPEMTPRQRVASVAYALMAGSVPDGSITTAKIANQSITADKLLPGAATPAGTISMFAGSTPPAGWLICDGSGVSRTTYAFLFAIIGTTYGAGDGTTTFNIPNLRDRFPMGLSGTRVLGSTGGESAHTLTIEEMPTHTHIQNSHSHGLTDPGHSHAATNGWNPSGDGYSHATPTQYPNDRPTSIAYTGISINSAAGSNQNAGGGVAHNNIPPYIVINYIIKY